MHTETKVSQNYIGRISLTFMFLIHEIKASLQEYLQKTYIVLHTSLEIKSNDGA